MIKTLTGLVLGIIIAAVVIIPITNWRTDAKLEAQRNQIALEAAQAEIETLKAVQPAEHLSEQAETPAETPEITTPVETLADKPQETLEPQEVSQPADEEEPTATAIDEVKPADVNAVEVKATPKPTAPPQATAKPAESEYPKEFYIDGQKYAYLTEYAEEAGIKTEIYEYAEGESNVIAGDLYDWENDPLGKVKGPFQ
jgi:type II secretory pathway pseudopilin PulG